MKNVILLVILAFLFSSCQQNNRDQSAYDMVGSEGKIILMTKES